MRVSREEGARTLIKYSKNLIKNHSRCGYSEITTEEISKIPGISENGLIIGNIGLGLSF